MKKIIRLTESDLTRIVKRVIEEQNQLNENVTFGDYTLTTQGGFIKDSKGNTMCVQVEALWPLGTFAQGITSLKQLPDGGLKIVPTGSKIGSVEVSKNDTTNLILSLKNGKTATIKDKATIKIGKDLVGWCRKQWS